MLGDPIQSYPTHGWTMAVSSSLHGMVHHDEFAGAFNGPLSAFAQFNNSAQPLCIARPRHVRCMSTGRSVPAYSMPAVNCRSARTGRYAMHRTRATSSRTNAPICRQNMCLLRCFRFIGGTAARVGAWPWPGTAAAEHAGRGRGRPPPFSRHSPFSAVRARAPTGHSGVQRRWGACPPSHPAACRPLAVVATPVAASPRTGLF